MLVNACVLGATDELSRRGLLGAGGRMASKFGARRGCLLMPPGPRDLGLLRLRCGFGRIDAITRRVALPCAEITRIEGDQGSGHERHNEPYHHHQKSSPRHR